MSGKDLLLASAAYLIIKGMVLEEKWSVDVDKENLLKQGAIVAKQVW